MLVNNVFRRQGSSEATCSRIKPMIQRHGGLEPEVGEGVRAGDLPDLVYVHRQGPREPGTEGPGLRAFAVHPRPAFFFR